MSSGAESSDWTGVAREAGAALASLMDALEGGGDNIVPLEHRWSAAERALNALPLAELASGEFEGEVDAELRRALEDVLCVVRLLERFASGEMEEIAPVLGRVRDVRARCGYYGRERQPGARLDCSG